MKVSVVVPVYNPGEHIRPLIDSLLAQTMPAEDFEVVFVDDGSTDRTPQLLDRLAAEHSHFRVVHQPNSGWPGRPRNVGIDNARGDYVFFCDNDDWFGVEALERLHACAERNHADIVIGKMVGHGRDVPRELFRENRDRATFANAPLQDSLTPHKLLRRAFVAEHGLRFPEGKRRLEDHVFVMKAFFAADVISVLSDYDCYHHVGRPDESNAAFRGIEPVSYYGYVRETIDVVVANTSPGVVRDRLLRRFLRVEILGRLEGRRFTHLSRRKRTALVAAARALVVETMPTSVDDGLPGRQRLLAQLLRAGDVASIAHLAHWRLSARARVRQVEWAGSTLRITWSARVGREGLVRRDRDRNTLVPPGSRGGADGLDVTRDLGKIKIDLVASDADRGEVILPGTARVEVTPAGEITATGDAEVAFGSGATRLDQGLWTLKVRARALGWVADSRPLGWPAPPPAWAMVPGPTLVRPTRSKRGALAIDVDARAGWLDAGLAQRTRSSVDDDGGVVVELPVTNRGVTTLTVRAGKTRCPATVAAEAAAITRVHVPPSFEGAALPLSLQLGSARASVALAVTATSEDGRVSVHRPVATSATLAARRLRTITMLTLGRALTRLPTRRGSQ